MVNNKIKVPYLDLSQSYHSIEPELRKGFSRVLNSGRVVLGKEVEEFEEQYAAFSSVKYAAGVGNGLDAITFSLLAVGIKSGDEVIVPANTYIATLIAVSRVGATTVLVEPRRETYNVDPDKIQNKITKKTKAIIPVHLYGQACEMDKIMQIAQKHHLFVVEDNAQSHGAKYKGRVTGSFGQINATSFYPGKNLGALGDGGAITTNDKQLYELVLKLRNYGEGKRYENDTLGYNSRLDELQAAFLKVRLIQLSDINKRKNEIAKIYLQQLKRVGDLILPQTHPKSTHVFHIFCIRTKKRDNLKRFLDEQGITTLIHYPIPSHLQKPYKFLGFRKGDFPITEELAQTSLSLPIFPEISDKQLDYVISQIRKFYK